MKEVFLQLVRSGIGLQQVWRLPEIINWDEIRALSMSAGLYAIVLDGVENMQPRHRPPQEFLLNWIGEVLQVESVGVAQQMAAIEMSSLFNSNFIRTYVLKGAVIAECYPKPKHRASVDMDCFLLPTQGDFDAWSLGNDLIKDSGI